ncbi:MAG: ATP-grasp domain-containing protein [Clostridia bacterium]|nr:ATP-grasp domain-containing protein [Clostridia bacterium]
MTTVWMNHWFSTAVNIIELLRKDNPDIHLICTNEHALSVIRNACDEWYQEPVLKDDEYVEFCLEFCQAHGVRVFMPRRGMVSISEHRDRFEKAGVRVMADRYAMVSVLNRKDQAFRFFAEKGIGAVPDYFIVKTAEDFVKAYEELAQKYSQVCFKFVRDEGGKSYRLIDNQRKGYAALFKKQTTRITLEEAVAAFSEREVFAPVMVMPFLSGDEVSVDCLNTKQGLIMLPRVKSYEKYEIFRYDDEIIRLCERFQREAALECPYNIQFKYLDGTPYFLEVNTRMSGGVQMGCLAGGVNLPQIAFRKMIGEETEWQLNRETKIVAQVLQPVLMEPAEETI